MSEISIRQINGKGFALYRDENLLMFGMSSADVKEFCAQYKEKNINLAQNAGVGASVRPNKIVAGNRDSSSNRRGGRPLILQAHIPTIRSMVDSNPTITKHEIMRHLRRRGVRFSSVEAVTNAARTHGIKLGA